MKKLLLLSLLFLSISLNAQINENVTPYQICNNNDTSPFATFDLTSKIPEILANMDPSVHSVAFFTNPDNAVNNVNPISAPSSFTNTFPEPQDIYVRVTNTQTNDVYYTSFTVRVDAAFAGTGSAITVCDSNQTMIDLFSLIAGEQVGGTWTRVTGSGGSFDAIGGYYIPGIGSTPSIFSYTISTQGCYDMSEATINIINTPNAGTDGAITVCDLSSTIVNLFDLITGEQPGGTWTRVSGTGGAFDAVLGTYIPADGATTSVFRYSLTGTAPCVEDWSNVIVTVDDCTSPSVCGGTFTDSGGVDGNYDANANITTTICPTNQGDVVSVSFTSFNTEAFMDALYVYNGASAISGTLFSSTNPAGNVPGGLPGGYWGDSIPGPFTSTSPSGCLTFVFRSGSGNNLDGWVANVNCVPPAACVAPIQLTASALTNNSVTLNWVQPANTDGSVATLWEIALLPQGTPAPEGNPNETIITATTNTNFVITGLVADNCYSIYIRSACSMTSEWSEPLDFCLNNCENAGNCTNSLALIAFLDDNNNGIKDDGELNFNYGNYVYQVNNNGDYFYGNANQNAYYIFDSNPNNSYDISFSINSSLTSYYNSIVSHNNITIPAGSGMNTLFFPVTAIQPYVDASVQLSSYGNPRPGFPYTIYINYKNYGSQNISNGTITFTKDPNVTITSISEPGSIITSSGFSFDFTNLAPFDNRYIIVNLLVPTLPMVYLGQLITNSAEIIINDDIYPTNNTSAISQQVTGSYDPNDKCELHGGKIVYDNFTSNDYLYYTIQFENTGTADAEFIKVEDIFDSQLDENSFEMINASHSLNAKRDGNQLTWHFYNINLPPTSSNPNESHGYVTFRIKPKAGYAIGDIIPNTASIYFDYNPPIITDTFNTEFVQALGAESFETTTVSIFPNPASNKITIRNNGIEGISKVNIYDISGKRIYAFEGNILNDFNIDVARFTKGLYLVEIFSENNTKITKKLILN